VSNLVLRKDKAAKKEVVKVPGKKTKPATKKSPVNNKTMSVKKA
jgi:hypothetical protein